MKKPNILLIQCHDLGHHIGCYPNNSAITPHFDRLATEGVVFDRHFATSPTCSPKGIDGGVSLKKTLISATSARLCVNSMTSQSPTDLIDSRSLVPLLQGNNTGWKDETISQYGNHLMIEWDPLKYHYSAPQPEAVPADPG